MNSPLETAYTDCLTLASVPGISLAQWHTLAEQYNASFAALAAGKIAASQAVTDKLCSALAKINTTRYMQCVEWQNQSDRHHLVPFTSEAYPALLKQLPDAPLILFVTGNLTRLHDCQVAMVGSRHASHGGLDTAQRLAYELAQAGLTITSGLATGIDGSAHKGSVSVGGRTIAVTGTGPDIVYPKRHSKLAQCIVEQGGAMVTELWPGNGPKAGHFPRRNRLIAAMTLATVVVEAKIRSGTLITANLAANMGRDVFAVPGSINNPMTEGCHHLIRQGAALITCTSDILEELSIYPCNEAAQVVHNSEKSRGESLATDKLLASVNYDVTSVDIITERSKLPVSEVLASLLQYELRGLVAAVPGGYIKLRGK